MQAKNQPAGKGVLEGNACAALRPRRFFSAQVAEPWLACGQHYRGFWGWKTYSINFNKIHVRQGIRTEPALLLAAQQSPTEQKLRFEFYSIEPTFADGLNKFSHIFNLIPRYEARI
ncbi:MAG: hypothetical protein K8963_06770 [Proteobacteria bacterium]|nr:hypothetical protein [Pseudomonadota bacterium]